MNNLEGTKWLQIDHKKKSGWTIHPGAVFPGDVLSLLDGRIHNKHIPFNSTSYYEYTTTEGQVIFEEATWEIKELSGDSLILTYKAEEFIFIPLPLQEEQKTVSVDHISNKLKSNKWETITENKTIGKTISIFLEDKIDFGEYIKYNYSVLLMTGYSPNLLKLPESNISGWKLSTIGNAFILSLFDYNESFRNFLLTESSENEIALNGRKNINLKLIEC